VRGSVSFFRDDGACGGALTTIRGTCSISDAPLIRDRNV